MVRAQRLWSVAIVLSGCGPQATQADRDGGALMAADASVSNDPDAEVCASVTVDLTRQTPTMALLVDRSSSMTKSFGNTNRWNAVYTTLMNPTNGVVVELQSSIRFGLYLFTDAVGACPRMIVVDPALGNYQAI